MIKKISWEFLENPFIADVYKRFVRGQSANQIRQELKNSEWAGSFGSLIKLKGVQKARNCARLALKRRKLL
jgi:hypothetical protein